MRIRSAAIVSVLLAVFFGVMGCQTNKAVKRESPAADKLVLLKCQDLISYYETTEAHLTKTRSDREKDNQLNAVSGIIGMILGEGSFEVKEVTQSERNMEIDLLATKEIMDTKQCDYD